MRRELATEVVYLIEKYGFDVKTALRMVYSSTFAEGEWNNSRKLSRIILDEVAERIRTEGITDEIIVFIDSVVRKICNGTIVFDRYPQRVLQGFSEGSEILCAAALVVRGCDSTESESRPIYQTQGLQGDGKEQIEYVHKWAELKGIWHQNAQEEMNLKFQASDEGTEAIVFFDTEKSHVVKLISLNHYNVLRTALDRIVIHNFLFPNTCLNVQGFGLDSAGRFVIIVRQPFIAGRLATESERMEYMKGLGFREAGEDYGMHLNYMTDELYVGDVNEYNAIMSADGVAVIDADCRLNFATLDCGGNYCLKP